MTSLRAILDEAAEQPFPQHTTCLATEHFETIRAPSSNQFRARLDEAVFGTGDLTEAHRANLRDGLEVIEPVQRGTHGGAWLLCNIAHAGEPFPAGDATYNSMADALQAAIEWWQIENWCRGILVRRIDLKQALAQEAANGATVAKPPPSPVTANLPDAAAAD